MRGLARNCFQNRKKASSHKAPCAGFAPTFLNSVRNSRMLKASSRPFMNTLAQNPPSLINSSLPSHPRTPLQLAHSQPMSFCNGFLMARRSKSSALKLSYHHNNPFSQNHTKHHQFSPPELAIRKTHSPAEEQNSPNNHNSSTSQETTHFGFSTIPTSDKKKKVGEVFHSVASRYDIMNDLMSAGLHRVWKTQFVNMANPLPGLKMLDVAGGTGDIAFGLVDHMMKNPNFLENDPRYKSEVVVFDINQSMLDVGQKRAEDRGLSKLTNPRLSWVQGDAEKLPFDENEFDTYTIAFGIRNCTDIPKVISEARRVLKKGGRFLVLEFSQVEDQYLRDFYDWYSFNIIPQVGKAVTGDFNSYQYLVESIRKFPPQEDFAKMIQNGGFKNVQYTNLNFGVVSIHSGFKL